MSTQNPLHMTLPIRCRAAAQGPVHINEKNDIVEKWDEYFGKNDDDLSKWKKLCRELGKPSETFTSKTQCRKVRGPQPPGWRTGGSPLADMLMPLMHTGTQGCLGQHP